jgi:hypothetical protein
VVLELDLRASHLLGRPASNVIFMWKLTKLKDTQIAGKIFLDVYRRMFSEEICI